jgi:hypothetical protein
MAFTFKVEYNEKKKRCKATVEIDAADFFVNKAAIVRRLIGHRLYMGISKEFFEHADRLKRHE